jgi:bisphosphoglycerate-independent phosphoglycerate mutase (AlkP superfamily)
MRVRLLKLDRRKRLATVNIEWEFDHFPADKAFDKESFIQIMEYVWSVFTHSYVKRGVQVVFGSTAKVLGCTASINQWEPNLVSKLEFKF